MLLLTENFYLVGDTITVIGNESNSVYERSGWNPNGGDLMKNLYFGSMNRYDNDNWYSTTNVPAVKNIGYVPNIACVNESDRFTVSNTNGNGALTYPVGLLTADEIIMAGATGNTNEVNRAYYLYTGNDYWTMSPKYFSYYDSITFCMSSYGVPGGSLVNTSYGVRPVVSLKLGTEFETGGDGTPTNPYVVKYD